MTDHFEGEMKFELAMKVRGNITPDLVAADLTKSLSREGWSEEAYTITPLNKTSDMPMPGEQWSPPDDQNATPRTVVASCYDPAVNADGEELPDGFALIVLNSAEPYYTLLVWRPGAGIEWAKAFHNIVFAGQEYREMTGCV